MMTTNRKPESGENPGRERPGESCRTGSVRGLRAGLRPEALHLLLLLLTGLLLVTSCDETFEPWQLNDRYHYSIYGYLDASADTQWVRVMPVREDFLLDPGQPLDATVTLEHVETGETVVMNDSLITYPQGTRAWNFWTTMPLQPEQSYRLTVERSDGAMSRASVTLPPDFPVPIVAISFSTAFGVEDQTTIYIEGIDHLVDVQTIFQVHLPQTDEYHLVTIPHLKDVFITTLGDYQVTFNPRDDYLFLTTFYPPRPSLSQHLSFYDARIFIAAGGPEYHHFPSIDEKIVSLPEGVSNIENGTGYLAGIVSKTFVYNNCYEEGTINRVPCEERPSPW